jgi:hypothetical protein
MSSFTLETSRGISVDLLRANPHRIYVFEDTLDCSSSLGQAMVRGEPNACGIPVRKSPGLTCKAVFSDQDHELEAVTEALRHLYRTGRNHTVVFPHTGIGHGPYGLVNHSPKIYEHVCQILKDHFGYQQPSLRKEPIATHEGDGSQHQQLFAQVHSRWDQHGQRHRSAAWTAAGGAQGSLLQGGCRAGGSSPPLPAPQAHLSMGQW